MPMLPQASRTSRSRAPRALALATVAALAIAVAAPALAQDGGEDVTLNITAHDDEEGNFWFEVEGLEGQNPTITLNAGDRVTVNFVNVGPNAVHNVHFGGGIDAQSGLLTPDGEDTLTFTVPDDAEPESEYWCDPHQGLGMLGPLQIEGVDGDGGTPPTPGPGTGPTGPTGPTPGDDDEETATPGVGIVVAALAVLGAAVAFAAYRRRRS